MTNKWEVGDRFRDRDGNGYFTGTIIQELDDDSFREFGDGDPYRYLIGRWRIRDGKRFASYSIVTEDRLRYASKKSEAKESAPKGSARDWARLYKEADAAGQQAGSFVVPTPMLVGTPKNMMASLMGQDDGGFDEDKPVYLVNDGVCGFAWVTIRPGNSSFARWLVKSEKGSKAYGGGISVWVRGFNQSMTRKEAYARAFAKVLQDAGISAYAESRMD